MSQNTCTILVKNTGQLTLGSISSDSDAGILPFSADTTDLPKEELTLSLSKPFIASPFSATSGLDFGGLDLF